MQQRRIVRFLLLFCCVLFVGKAVAQPENNIWLFGNMGGMTFNGSGPELYSGSAMDAYIPSVSVSNATGQLLFYSEGTKVWNSAHVLMPNGNNLQANYYPTVTQGVIAMPFIGDTNKYYLFTLEGYQPNNQNSKRFLRYSIIDMSLNGGLGDIIPGQKNVVLDSFMSPSLTTVRGSGCFNWLVAHKQSEGRFVTYKIDETGIVAVVSSEVSALPFPPGYNPFGSQEIKISPDTRLLGWAHSFYAYNSGNVELYDFDNATGLVSNPRMLDTFWDSHAGQYGIEFSPDNTKFYFTNFSFSAVYQMDLSLLPDLTAVYNSKLNLSPGYTSYTGLRRGPDGKIYVKSPTYVSVIHEPDNAGLTCDFQFGLFSMGGNYGWRLGDPITINKADSSFSRTDTALCLVDTAWFSAPPGGENYVWSDGTLGPLTFFTTPGTKWVQSNQGCGTRIDTFVVTAAMPDTLFYQQDTTVCFLLPVSLSAPVGYSHYTWNNNSSSQELLITQPGIYYVRSREDCHLRIDTFHVAAFGSDTLRFQHDTSICFVGAATLALSESYDQYLWSDGSQASQLSVTTDGTYWVQAQRASDCRYRIDTFRLRFYDFELDLGSDTALCPGDSIQLSVAVGGADYYWSNGSTAPENTLAGPGRYWVRVHLDGCERTDTLIVSERQLLVDFGADTVLCMDREGMLELDLDYAGSNYQYLWSDGSMEQTLSVSAPGTYWGTVTQGSCIASDTLTVGFVRCDNCINIPNAFSPNGDGLNDFFEVQVYCPVAEFTLSVYNRYGQRVFLSHQPGVPWDGRQQGSPCDLDTYFYDVKLVTDTPERTTIRRKGDLILLR